MEQLPAQTWVCLNAQDEIVGIYYLKANQPGQGSHVCNCGYVVNTPARGLGRVSPLKFATKSK